MTERRFLSEIRADSQGDELSLVGYASIFNSQSEDLGGFKETVMPGAFSRTLREGNDVKCLMNHDPSLVLGRVKNGTLKLEEDAHGLRFRCILPPTQTARDLYALVKRGDIDSCSFAFIPKEQSWEDTRSDNGDLYANRKLLDVDLLDVSAVCAPAYNGTSLSARSLFPDGEPAEMRSALAALVAKRGSEATIPMPYAISLPQPFDSDMKQEWWDAFMLAYIDAVHVQKIHGQEAISSAIAAANLVWQPQTEVTPEVAGQSKNPSSVPGEIVKTDAMRALEVAEAEKRNSMCRCQCADCLNGDCLDCSDDTCDDINCDANDEGDLIDNERTKKVGDVVLRASDFAFVGDPNIAKTWKMPLDTTAHVTNSLHRFHDVKGIPADQKEGVWRTIIAACKKQDVKVTEEDSLRAAISHDVTTAVLNEVVWDQVAEDLNARLRMIQIDLE